MLILADLKQGQFLSVVANRWDFTIIRGYFVVWACSAMQWDFCFVVPSLVTVCSWNTDVIMVWAWMLCESHAMRTRTLLWFRHGFSANRMQ